MSIPSRRRAGRPVVVVVTVALLGAVLAGCTGSDAATGVPPDASAPTPQGPPAGAGGTAPSVTTTAFLPTTSVPGRDLRTVGDGACPPAFRRDTVPVPTTRPSPPLPSTIGIPSTTAPPTTAAPGPTAAPTTAATTSPTTEAPSSSGASTTGPPAEPWPDGPTALTRLRSDPRLAGTTTSVSVWIDGLGELALNPDLALIPASNQKIITAMAATALLDAGARLRTDVIATGPVVDGVLQGDLVLVGGGDPTLRRSGEHSVDQLAEAVAGAGIREVRGRILVDDGRYDDHRSVSSWRSDWPESIGPMSALVVDWNYYRKDDDFRADPTIGNGQVLQVALSFRGVAVSGGVERGSAASGVRVASLESPTIGGLVASMLLTSDNLIAELLIKEIGFRRTGQPGSTADGIAAAREVVSKLCTTPTGADADGSGLSRENRRSARELRRLLQSAAVQPWGAGFRAALPTSGPDEVLGGRLKDPPAGGRVQAKGGRLFVSRSLSGYLTTASGRAVVFSVLVNGDSMAKVEPAIDDFVQSLAGLTL